MSQPNHKFDYNSAQAREPYGKPAISSMPPQGLSGEADPTVEIRQLINQLQASVREARDRVSVVERERDAYREQLDDARAQLIQIKSREEESRVRFVEVTAVIRERDDLLASLDQHQKSIAELQRRLDAAQRQEMEVQRQRGAAIIERDKALREHEAAMAGRNELGRERDDLRAKLAEVQRQVVSIRQARDASQAQCHDLHLKVQGLTDQLAELSHERESARGAVRALDEARQKCEAALAERDQLSAKLAESGREIEAQQKRVLELVQEQAQVARSSTEHAAALAAAREDLIKLTQERDAARTRAQGKDRELEDLRTELQRAREHGSSGEFTDLERDSLTERVQALIAERETLQGQISSLQQQGLTQEQRMAQYLEQCAAAQRGREELLNSLTAAQKQIERLMRERDEIRQQGIERILELEAAVQAGGGDAGELEARVLEADARVAAAERERDRAQELGSKFEEQRLQAIELAAQLDAAKREIKRLTADVAEARLEARAASVRVARIREAQATAPTPLEEAPRPIGAGAEAHVETEKVVPTYSTEVDEEALSEKEGRQLVAEMKRCFSSFSKDPTDLSLLNELHCHVQHFAERARVSGYLALHRLARAFSSLAQDLYRFPEQVNPSTLRTVNQSIEFLGTLLKQKNYGSIKDPAKAMIFAVDDDAENCDAIRMAMENVMMRTRTAQEPSVALAELSAGKYDLILLDIALPHMDGFELCQHVRGLPEHARTPIVFLTGLTTMENRVQSSLSGGNDFVGKPFNLHELGVKALTLVLKNALNME